MIPVVWTMEALDDIEAIAVHVAEDDLVAAIRLVDRIVDAVDGMLPGNPRIGRPGRAQGTRELVVHRNYVVAYRITGSRIDVLTVRHAARMWPDTIPGPVR